MHGNTQLGVDTEPNARNSTVDRSLRVLEAFLGEENELGVLEISRQLDLDKSVIHRILATLVGRRFLEQDPVSRRYRVGLRAWELGQRYMAGQLIEVIAERELTRMIANHPYATGYLAQLDGGDIVVSSTIRGPGPINLTIDPGTRMMAELTTTGRTMLAELDPRTVEQLVLRRRQYQPEGRDPGSLEDLQADLVEIRKRGYGVSNGRYTPGVGTVAFAVKNATGDPLVALSVDFLAGDQTKSLMTDLPGEIAECIRQIEHVLRASSDEQNLRRRPAADDL
jgi:IclR family acetate operon transcriptional repressor